MENVEILGFTAALLTTIAFFPQVAKTYKSRSAKDLSLGMLLFFTTGVTLWFVYGIIIEKLPIIVANGVTLILIFALIYFKITFKK